jgi:chemotaxis protein CheD
MSVCTLPEINKRTMVGMGQIAAARTPTELMSVLGSCVGVAIYHPRLHAGALAHVVLPRSHDHQSGSPGKFADTAIPELIRQLEQIGVSRSGLLAKITGGACLFGTSGPLQIGLNNVEAVLHAVNSVGIRIVAQDVGGSKGRKITFQPDTGEIKVEIVGQKAYTI